jgi:hypothetical protein
MSVVTFTVRPGEASYHCVYWFERPLVRNAAMLPNDYSLCLYRSAPIDIEAIGFVHARLSNPRTGSVHLIRAEIKLDGPTVFVALHSAKNDWPFLIENASNFDISLQQNVRGFVFIYGYILKIGAGSRGWGDIQNDSDLLCKTSKHPPVRLGLSSGKTTRHLRDHQWPPPSY